MIPRDSQMQKDKHILDNRLNTVVNYLREHLPTAEIFRLVSAYFTIYGYEALQNELHGIKDVRFLFGDPASVGEVDPSEKTEKSFDLVEGRLRKWRRSSGRQFQLYPQRFGLWNECKCGNQSGDWRRGNTRRTQRMV